MPSIVPGLGMRALLLEVENRQTYYRANALAPRPVRRHRLDGARPLSRAHLAGDVSFRFGNADPVIGRDNVREAWSGFCEGLDGVSHEVIEQFESGPATVSRATVTYTRKDGSTISLPVVTIYRGEDEQIDDYRIFMDVAPLFAADRRRGRDRGRARRLPRGRHLRGRSEAASTTRIRELFIPRGLLDPQQRRRARGHERRGVHRAAPGERGLRSTDRVPGDRARQR